MYQSKIIFAGPCRSRFLKFTLRLAAGLKLSLCLALVGIFLFQSESRAEPWISNRFAQNCVACHAPGRYNVVSSKRRCTLSCQGCHVNPNGGGMRNLYGRWNQEYWLYSFTPKAWRLGKGKPLPQNQQEYSAESLKSSLDKISPESENPARREALDRIIDKGLPLKATRDRLIPESEFDRHKGAFEKIVVSNDRFILGIPYEDPLRQKDEQIVRAGAGMRYFHLESTDKNGVKTKRDFLMAADVGVQVEPLKRVSFVTEAALANGAYTEFFQSYTAMSFIRSAYLMADDLPYNTYLMTGLYRPMFGNYDVDHNSILSVLTNLRYNSVFRATSIGTAPNVPFLNVHLISPIAGTPSGIDSEGAKAKGIAVNLGARFVTLGASATASFWDTKAETSSDEIKRNMMSLALGGMYKNWIPNIDFVRVKKETRTRVDETSIFSIKNKFKLWREMYLLGNFASANTAMSLVSGKTSEYGFGLKTYMVAGVDLEILYYQRKSENDTGIEFDNKYLQGQLHLFF